MFTGILLQISGGASGDHWVLVADTDHLFHIIIDGIGILLLFFQTVKFHLKIFHIRRSFTHTCSIFVLAPVHGGPFVLVFAGAFHAQFFPIIEEYIAIH